MPEGWKTYRLGDHIDLINGFAFKSKDFIEAGVPVIKIKNVKANKILLSDLSFVSEEVADKAEKAKLNQGDLIITLTGNRKGGGPDSWVGKVAHFINKDHYLLNQRVGAIRVINADVINQNYLGYYLSSWEMQKFFIEIATGAGGQANISPNQVKDVELNLPPLQEQKAIASILSALDDKIELNLQQNKTLEEMAMALYKHWFVDFGPFQEGEFIESELGMIPKGWEVKSFSDFAEHKKGDIVDGPFGSNLKSSDYTEEGVRLVHQQNIDEYNFSNKEKRFTSEEKYQEVIRSEAKPGDIVMAKMPEPIARACILPDIEEKYIVMADVVRVRPNETLSPTSYLLYLVNSEFFRNQALNHATGSTRPRINLSIVRNQIKVLDPGTKIIQEYDRIVSEWENQRSINTKENQTLTTLRDALLPKLISGEIRVKDAEQELKKVL